MPCEYFLLIRRQRRPCLLAIVDGLSLAGQHDRYVESTDLLNILSVERPIRTAEAFESRLLASRSSLTNMAAGRMHSRHLAGTRLLYVGEVSWIFAYFIKPCRPTKIRCRLHRRRIAIV